MGDLPITQRIQITCKLTFPSHCDMITVVELTSLAAVVSITARLMLSGENRTIDRGLWLRCAHLPLRARMGMVETISYPSEDHG